MALNLKKTGDRESKETGYFFRDLNILRLR